MSWEPVCQMHQQRGVETWGQGKNVDTKKKKLTKNLWNTRSDTATMRTSTEIAHEPKWLRMCCSSHYPGEFNPWISKVTEDTLVLTSTVRPVTCGERQIPDSTESFFQIRPSPRNSFDPKEGRFSNNYGADQQRLQISKLHLDNFPTPNNIRLWWDKIQNWGMYWFRSSYRNNAME